MGARSWELGVRCLVKEATTWRRQEYNNLAKSLRLSGYTRVRCASKTLQSINRPLPIAAYNTKVQRMVFCVAIFFLILRISRRTNEPDEQTLFRHAALHRQRATQRRVYNFHRRRDHITLYQLFPKKNFNSPPTR